MTDDDARPGFDRRALIKKGLVAGGIAATVPVITTFNTAAFAASQPGCHRVQFNITGASNAGGTATLISPPTATVCLPSTAGCVGPVQVTFITSAAQITANVVGNAYTFQLVGDYASCEFLDGTASTPGNTQCIDAPTTGWGAMGGSSVTFQRTAFTGNQSTFTVVLIVNC